MLVRLRRHNIPRILFAGSTGTGTKSLPLLNLVELGPNTLNTIYEQKSIIFDVCVADLVLDSTQRLKGPTSPPGDL